MEELTLWTVYARSIGWAVSLVLLITLFGVTVTGQDATKATLPDNREISGRLYPNMAPLAEYLTKDRGREIALARSAAPASISKDAEVLVLTAKGYTTAVTGTNGFVCLVDRSWQSSLSDPEFWNPKIRAPTCLNPQAARSVLPLQMKRTELVLAGVSRLEIVSRAAATANGNRVDSPQPGAMSYMMSKQQYLGDRYLNWMPHVMIYTPKTMKASDWGANQPGSPVMGGPSDDGQDQVIIFLVPVSHWSDGSAAMKGSH